MMMSPKVLMITRFPACLNSQPSLPDLGTASCACSPLIRGVAGSHTYQTHRPAFMLVLCKQGLQLPKWHQGSQPACGGSSASLHEHALHQRLTSAIPDEAEI